MNTKLLMQIALVTGSMWMTALAQPKPKPRPTPDDMADTVSRAMEDARKAADLHTWPDQDQIQRFKEDARRAAEDMKFNFDFDFDLAVGPDAEQLERIRENAKQAADKMRLDFKFAEKMKPDTEELERIKEDTRRMVEDMKFEFKFEPQMGRFDAVNKALWAMQQAPAPPQPAAAPSPSPAPAPAVFTLGGKGRRGDDEERLYRSGKSALEGREWDKAAECFQRIVEIKGTRSDAAMYWKAYALNKLGRRSEASATLAELTKTYSSSRWLDDAKALEVEVKQSSGQAVSPDSEADEELKILALNGMIHSDPDRALPVLERLLQKGGTSPRLKDRAVFVLAQSKSPKSREILLKLARGGTNPDLQYKAVEYLGYQSTPETRQALSELYSSTNDVQLKRAVLRGFTASRDKDRLLTAAKGEQSPDLRREAIRGLGSVEATAELWQLFQNESNKDIKIEIVHQLPGRRENFDKLLEVAKAEKDPGVRVELIRQIGNYGRGGSEKTSEALVALYAPETNTEARRAIIGSLRNLNNGKALVDIARVETDMKLKQSIVEQLSHMKTKEAQDYLLELLNK